MRWLEVERFAYTPFGTFGRLTVHSEFETPRDAYGPAPLFECFTVEPAWENNAVGRSCVPVGRYPLKLEYSPRFKRPLWELKDVPGRSESKLHEANLAEQLNGCIAPGLRLDAINGKWAVISSAVALKRIHEVMDGQMEAYIIIKNAPEQGALAAA